MGKLKWERTLPCRTGAYYGYIVSSDYYKYEQVPWKFMEGKANMYLILAFEYQRRWQKERELWKLKMFPPEFEKVDVVKRYVLSFKAKAKAIKEEREKAKEKEEGKAFKMKQFENIPSRTVNKKEKVGEKKDKNEEEQCKKLK